MIIVNNYKIRSHLTLMIFTILLFSSVRAQNSGDPYYLRASVGAGYGRFITDMNLNGLNKNGFASTIRVMWQPEHLLRIGIESGYYFLYNYEENITDPDFGETDVKGSLAAVPIIIDFAMQIAPLFEIYLGIGPTLLITSFDSYGHETSSTQISTSYLIAITYAYPISDRSFLSAEVKGHHINKIEDSTLSFQLSYTYRLLEW